MVPGGTPRGSRDIGDAPFDRTADPLLTQVNFWGQSPLTSFLDYKYNYGAGTLESDQERLLAEMDDAAVVKPENVAHCMTEYTKMMSCSTRLYACAVCATSSYDFPDTPPHVPLRVSHSPALELLRLNRQDREALLDIPRRYRPARSFYPRPRQDEPLPRGPLYWLDPKLVSPDGTVMACGTCAVCFRVGARQCERVWRCPCACVCEICTTGCLFAGGVHEPIPHANAAPSQRPTAHACAHWDTASMRVPLHGGTPDASTSQPVCRGFGALWGGFTSNPFVSTWKFSMCGHVVLPTNRVGSLGSCRICLSGGQQQYVGGGAHTSARALAHAPRRD